MTQTNNEISHESHDDREAKRRTHQEIEAAHDRIAASPEVLAATLEGLEQLARGDYVRVSRKKP